MFRQSESEVRKPPYLVLCGCHVRKLASFLSTFGLVSLFPLLILTPLAPFCLIPIIIFGPCHVCALLADRKANPHLYIPTLVMQAIPLAVMPVAAGALIIANFMILMNVGFDDSVKKQNVFGLFVYYPLAVTLILDCLFVASFWIQYQVFRVFYYAREYLIREVVPITSKHSVKQNLITAAKHSNLLTSDTFEP